MPRAMAPPTHHRRRGVRRQVAVFRAVAREVGSAVREAADDAVTAFRGRMTREAMEGADRLRSVGQRLKAAGRDARRSVLRVGLALSILPLISLLAMGVVG